jgi:hypothetical protein
MPLRELSEKWQASHNEWQGEAMHQAKRREGDGSAIEPISRFLCILIHRGLSGAKDIL